MSACPQCGTVAKPGDKFCNTCGTPIIQAGGPSPGGAPGPGGGLPAYPVHVSPPAGWSPQQQPPPPQQQGYGQQQPYPGAPGGGAAPSRCQMGHDIAPGASYCPQGHPIALDAMQFASDAYGPGGGGGYGQPQQQQQQQGFGAPQQQQGMPPQYGGPPQAPQYGPPPQPPGPPGFGAPPGPGGAGGFGNDMGGFGGPPQPPQPPVYGAPPVPQPAPFGQAPPQPYGAPAPQPPAAPAPAADVPPNALRGFLVSYQANTGGDFWPLTGGRLVVGRSNSGEKVDVPLSDPTISSRHAAFLVDAPGGTITLEDTGSTNGTFVNDEHLGFNGRRELKDGDRIRFGGFNCVVKVIARV